MKISLRKKLLKSGMYSLYIEYYKGSSTVDGKKKHDREFEYLSLYIYQEPKNPTEKRKNKEVYDLAEQIFSIRKAEYAQGKYDLKNTTKLKVSFLSFFQHLMEEKRLNTSESNYSSWVSTYRHLEKYCPSALQFREIDLKFAEGFRNYLEHEALTSAQAKLSKNTKHAYFNNFILALKIAFEDGYLANNLPPKIKRFGSDESKREYLTFEEVEALANTHCKYAVLKQAFLFSCFTGLRFSDCENLKWADVRDEEAGCKLVYRQQKTEGQEYLFINEYARQLMGERKGEADKVFIGLFYRTQFNIALSEWCRQAGILKKITFHCARHTHAVILLEKGADIYTVSKMLGHRDLKTTQIYAKMVDKKMQETANLIPNLKII